MSPRSLPLAILLALVALPAFSAMGDYPQHAVILKSVIDGDTIDATVESSGAPVDLGFGASIVPRLSRETHIRMAGFDAWESTRVRFGKETREEELRRGKLAKTALEKLLQDASHIYGEPDGKWKDNFGRLLLKLKIVDRDGKVSDVAELMRGMGHEREGAK